MSSTNVINATTETTLFCAQEDWQNRPITIIYIIHGVPYVLLYIPCLVVMGRKPLRENTCYQIMTFIGVLDLFGLIASAFLPSAMSFLGLAWCDPNSLQATKMATALGFGIWMSYGFACQVLAVNRLAAMVKPSLIPRYFGQRHVLIYMGASLFIGIAMGVWHDLLPAAFVYDPRLGFYILQEHTSVYLRTTHTVFNSVLAISLVIIYACVLRSLRKKSSLVSNNANQSNMMAMERSVTMQSVVLCSLTMFAAFGYVLIPLMAPPPIIYQITQVAWQAVHGSTPLVYLFLNRTIRKQVFGLFGMKAAPPTTTTAFRMKAAPPTTTTAFRMKAAPSTKTRVATTKV